MRGAHGTGDLLGLAQGELDARPLARPPPVVGQAWCRQAPGVAHVRIKVDDLVRERQVLGLRVERGMAREIFPDEVAIGLAPVRRAGRRRHAD
jgi:hypothetical protein